MKKRNEKEPLEEQLQNIIRKKLEENEALNKLLKKLSDSDDDKDNKGIPDKEKQ